MIGQTVSHYRIVERLGGGGMGVVFRAEDLRLGRAVALKFLPPELGDDPRAKERFLVEARAASALDHPNVCTIYEAGETRDGRMYLAMAYYEGETLAERVRRGALPPDEAIEVAIRVARGLERAHQAGILHRDVKPSNIALTRHGEVKILDFGLAKLADSTALTRSGTTMGTPAYIAPEQIRGEEIDARADLWSLGVVLYEMLAGRPPFTGDSTPAVMHSILHGDPQPLSRLQRRVPEPLETIVARLLAKDPAGRYGSARELADDLTALRQRSDLPTRALETGATRPAPGTARTAWSRALPWVAGAALLLVAVAAWLAFGRGASRERAAKPATATSSSSAIAVLPFVVRGSDEFAYLGEGIVDLLGTKLDGAGDLRSVDPHALLAFLGREGLSADREGAEAVARQFGASYYLLGDILEAGGRLHLSASLYRPGETTAVTRATAEGDAARIFDLVDRLASELLADRFTGPGERVTKIAAVTTESLSALKAYLQGESQFRAGQFSKSLESFQRAVEQDPEFALAWYRLSVAAEWALRIDLTSETAARAVRLSDRLSDHDRSLLEARLANRGGDADEAERLYRALIGIYPDDVEAWSQLAEVLFHYGPPRGRSIGESREVWERTLFFEPDNVGALWHLARVVAAEGKRDDVRAVVERILRLNPEGERALEMRALRDFALGDTEEQVRVLADLRAAGDNILPLAAWNVAAYAGNIDGAARIARLLTDNTRSADSRALGHVILAWLELARGRLRLADGELDAAAALRPGWALEHRALMAAIPFVPATPERLREIRDRLARWDAAAEPPAASPGSFFAVNDRFHPLLRVYLIGLMEATLGDDTALRRAKEVAGTESPPDASRLTADMAQMIRARLARARGDAAGALREMERAQLRTLYQLHISSPFGSQALERFCLGELLAESGRHDEALRWLSSFAEISYYDVAYLAPAHLWRGRILEGQGRSDRAIAEYRRVVELWSGCDPELRPGLEEARGRTEHLSADAAGG